MTRTGGAWLEALLLGAMVLFVLLGQGCGGFPDVGDLGVVMSGHVCVGGALGWEDGEWVAEAELEACIDEARVHWGEHFDHTAALGVCLEIMTADAESEGE